MKKYIKYLLTAGLVMMFFVMPNISSAATIEELKAMIASLTAQLNALIAAQGNSSGEFCYTFDTNIGINSNPGSYVVALREALKRENLGVSVGSEDVFDETLSSAVSAFQEKYKSEILTPNGLKYPTGFVGKATRAKLNALYGCNNSTSGVSDANPAAIGMYWFDSNNKSCSYKQFWGAYMYEGLQTFATEADCKAHLSGSTQPSITVLSPNGGESYITNVSTIHITYKSSGITDQSINAYLYSPVSGNVRIYYGVAGTSGFIDMDLIKAGAPDAGQYKITLCAPNVTTDSGKPLCDSSDNYFTIISNTQTATPVISSISALSVKAGDTVTLTGSNFDGSSYIQIDGNQTFAPTSYSTNSISFVVPTGLASGSHTVQVGQKAGSVSNSFSFMVSTPVSLICEYPAPPVGCSYQSGPNYNPSTSCGLILVCPIQDPLAVKVVSPNGGELFYFGDVVNFKWTGGRNKVSVAIVKDGVQVDSNLASNILGYILRDADASYLSGSYSGRIVSDASGLNYITLSAGKYKLLIISQDTNGNITIWDKLNNRPGNVDLSDSSFTFAERTVSSISLDQVASALQAIQSAINSLNK